MDNLISLAIHRESFKRFYNLIEIQEDNRAIRFIKSNLLDFKLNKFLYDDTNKYIYLLNEFDNNIIGYCILNLKNFGKPEKFTDLKTLYDEFFIQKEIPENLNVLSTIFHILDVNINLIVTIFDDIINSFFYPNSIFSLNYTDFKDFNHFFANNFHGELKVKESQPIKCFNWQTFLFDNSIKNKIYDIQDLRRYEKKHSVNFNLSNYFL